MLLSPEYLQVNCLNPITAEVLTCLDQIGVPIANVKGLGGSTLFLGPKYYFGLVVKVGFS